MYYFTNTWTNIAGSAPCFVYLTLGNNASSQLNVHFQAGRIYNNPTVRFDTQPRSVSFNLL